MRGRLVEVKQPGKGLKMELYLIIQEREKKKISWRLRQRWDREHIHM